MFKYANSTVAECRPCYWQNI